MAASWGSSAAPYLSGPTVNLERVLMADIYAAGGVRASSIQENLDDGTPEPVDLSVVNLYANFVLNNPQLMTQTTTNAQTLLLQSAPSMFGALAAQAETIGWDGNTDYIGTGRLLLDTGINYDSLFVPDTSYSQLPPLTLAALTPYKVVIAPYSWSLDDNQVSVLLGYAQQGGTLIIDGDFANSQPDGTPANRPNVQAILATQGAQPYGSGTIVVTNAEYGIQYENNQFASNAISVQASIQAAFVSFLAPYISPTVAVTQPLPQIHQPGVGAFYYHDANGHALVHLVNYDYNDSTDQFVTKNNIQIQVQVGSQPVNAVVLRSPDIAGPQSLPFTKNGSTVTVTVPQIYAWDILYFETSTLAPVISSTTPVATLGAVAGDSLTFNAQASGADGNPLIYTWSVNGQVVANVLTPSYTVQLPITASGLYTITVSVSDGARVTETSWTVNVKASGPPTVLFDETHGEAYSINLATAGMIYPGQPEFASYADLAQALQPTYTTSRLTSGSITSQILSGVSALVLPAPNVPLSSAEQLAITNFVQNGGGLIFMTQAGSDTSINFLLGPWGINIDSPLLLAPVLGSYFFASASPGNPLLPPDASFLTADAASLNISPPAVSLIRTDATVWRSVSGQPTQQPGDPNGPFTVIASTQYGSGRVFVVSDAAAYDDVYICCSSNSPNAPIFLAGLAWVSAPSNPPAIAPNPPAVSISSIVNAASFAAPISPGSWVTLSGQNLANAPPSGVVWSAANFNGNLLPTSLNGTSVLINGQPAAVEFISPGQVNVLAPDDSYSGKVQIQAIGPSGIAAGTVSLQPLTPALFPVVVGGTTYAAAVGLDGSIIGPTSLPGTRTAKSGETLELYGTGFGDTDPHQPANQLVSVAPLVNTVTATICGQAAAVGFAGLVGSGLDQINVTLPSVPPGNCTVQLNVAGSPTQSGIVIPIGQ